MNSPAPLFDGIRVQEITGTNCVPLTYELRYRVWSLEAEILQPFELRNAIYDEHDDHARHWAAFSSSGELVASARVCVHGIKKDLPEAHCYIDLNLPSPTASLNRLVVLEAWRRQGIARELDVRRLTAAKESGAACIVVAPTHKSRARQLTSLGFSPTSSKCKCIYKKDHWLNSMVLYLQNPSPEE